MRRAAVGVVVALGACLVAGCGGSSPKAGGTTATTTTTTAVSGTARRAAALLDAGLAAQAQGHDAEAAADYLSALRIDPADTLAWYNLGLIAEQHGQTADATHDYEQAIATRADYVPALYNLAIVVTPSDPAEAARLYRRCVAAQPSDADAWLNLGFVERTLGDTRAADADFARAVALDPSLKARLGAPTRR
jgi:Tfp pilus assembly protein PilF